MELVPFCSAILGLPPSLPVKANLVPIAKSSDDI